MNILFNGLGMGLGNLSRLSKADTRSISAENPTGEKGRGGMATPGSGDYARELGQGWKISPCINVPPRQTVTLADIQEPGAIQHIWMTMAPSLWRRLVLRFYRDDETIPSVEVPVGDFFCNGWGVRCNVTSQPVAVNPAGGFNCYWEMPFSRRARITVENLSPDEAFDFFYQIDYTLTEVPTDLAYFHAQWRRSDSVKPMEVHTLLDDVRGHGHYVGTYLAWGVHNNDWWGEGEIKFYLDGDAEWPTICGTGTEDYFGGAWSFEYPQGQYGLYSTPYLGLPQVIQPDGLYQSQQRFGLYRWHILDPIRFQQDLRVTIQDLGFRSSLEGKGRFYPRRDDVASTAFWYQAEPHAPFPELPGLDDLEVIWAMQGLLLDHPAPDFDELLSILRGEKTPGRVPIFEIGIDTEVLRSIQESFLDEPWALPDGVSGPSSPDERYYQQLINLYYRLGYDFVPLWPLWVNNPAGQIRQTADTAGASRGLRDWVNESGAA